MPLSIDPSSKLSYTWWGTPLTGQNGPLAFPLHPAVTPLGRDVTPYVLATGSTSSPSWMIRVSSGTACGRAGAV